MFGFGECGKQGGGGFGPPWGSTHAQNGRTGCGPLAILHDLDLTDEQLEKLAELKLEGSGKIHSI